MKSIFSLCLACTILLTGFAQDTINNYIFTPIQTCEAGEVESQGATGTCWSFSTHSFLESELLRQEKPYVDLSEMYATYYIYLRKAENYVRRHGRSNFDEGSLGHDVIYVLDRYGVVPEADYSGLKTDQTKHDHSKLFKELEKYMKKALKKAKNEPPANWEQDVRAILNSYLGTPPTTVMHAGANMNTQAYAQSHLGLNPDDYVSITSYTHHPYFKEIVLEVPDNWSNGSFYNVPLEDLLAIAEGALQRGFSFTWDGDVSEPGFSARNSLALMPTGTVEAAFQGPQLEKDITPSQRQAAFDNWESTDDHLMHVTGLMKDQKENMYFQVKNSWGEIGPGNGYLYMSEPFFRYGTVSILLHKDAIPQEYKQRLGL